jgi:hypothetical protein
MDEGRHFCQRIFKNFDNQVDLQNYKYDANGNPFRTQYVWLGVRRSLLLRCGVYKFIVVQDMIVKWIMC